MESALSGIFSSVFGGAPGSAASAAAPPGAGSEPTNVYFGRTSGQRMTPVVGGNEALIPGRSRLREVEEEDDVRSIEEAMAMFYEDDFDLQRLGEEAEKYGLKAETLDDLLKVWEDAVTYSANKYANGSKKTPWEMIPLMAGAWRGDGSDADRSRALAAALQEPRTITQTAYTAGRTITETATQTDISNPEQSRALVQDVLSRDLGRWATGAELAEFIGTLNTYQRENPTVQTRTTEIAPETTTQTTTEDVDGNQSTSTSTVGGESNTSTSVQQGATAEGAQQLLLEEAMEQPDYGAYQAATTYMGALLQALESPV
jgi:hypothetical protein